MINRDRVLNRFLRYVQVDTTAVEGADGYPSSPGQLTLGAMLVDELREIGLTDVAQDEHGIVIATVPSRNADSAPVVAFNSHVDTSPETTGAHVRPQVIHDYQGGDIVLAGGMESMSNTPYLLRRARFGYRLGHDRVEDGMYSDGFMCPLCNELMGSTAENLAQRYDISRSDQDQYALSSQHRAEAAVAAGKFAAEVVPVTVSHRRSAPRWCRTTRR